MFINYGSIFIFTIRNLFLVCYTMENSFKTIFKLPSLQLRHSYSYLVCSQCLRQQFVPPHCTVLLHSTKQRHILLLIFIVNQMFEILNYLCTFQFCYHGVYINVSYWYIFNIIITGGALCFFWASFLRLRYGPTFCFFVF